MVYKDASKEEKRRLTLIIEDSGVIMGNERTTTVTISTQGFPILSNNKGYMVKGNDEAVCFYVDLTTKYCEVIAYSADENGSPELMISSTEKTPSQPDTSEDTIISFPEFIGWDIHCASITKYTLAVALVKS